MQKGLALALLVLAVVAGGVYWGVQSAGSRWRQNAPGVEVRVLRAPVGEGAVTVTAIRTDAWRVQVVAGKSADAAGWRKRYNAIAAINGGFFDKEGKSLGLRVANRRRVSALHPADWGVFYVRNGQSQVVHSRDYQKQRGITQAVQCGPRLVVDGKVTSLKRQYAQRTGIGVQRDVKVIIAVTELPLSLPGWAAVWADRDGLNCRDALNLDGGPSTQMNLQSQSRAVNITGAWPVPDAIIIK
jgi:exopolysaccharide biosynthesis protein